LSLTGSSFTRGTFPVSYEVHLALSPKCYPDYRSHILANAKDSLDLLKCVEKDPFCRNPFPHLYSQGDPLLKQRVSFEKDLENYTSHSQLSKKKCIFYGVVAGILLTGAIVNHHYNVL